MSDATIISALRDIFDSVLGADAIYTPAGGGTAVACRVMLERDILLQPGDMSAQVYQRGNTIEALLDDLGAEPARGATFVINDETFTVQAPEKNDGDTVLLIVK